MSPLVLRILPLLLASALAPPAARAEFWVTPDPVVAQQPSRVVFTTWSYGGDPQVEVRVDGDQIVLRQTHLCGEICFSARIPARAEAALPPLPPGSYTVLLEWAGEDEPPVEAATLEVGAGLVTRMRPAEGFWSPVGQQGSGLFLERRGELLAVSLYSYLPFEDAAPFWLLGTGSYAGDTAPLLLRGYRDGDCLGCAEHRAAAGPFGTTAVQLRFESARRAWLDIVGGASALPLVSLPFGAAYLPQTLADSVDAEFGPLPLPDLRGEWIFTIEGADAPDAHLGVTLQEWSVDGEAIGFSGTVAVECRSAAEGAPAGCAFVPDLQFSPPLDEPANTFFGAGWFVALGDLEHDRMRGGFEAGGRSWQVQGFRTAAPPAGD